MSMKIVHWYLDFVEDYDEVLREFSEVVIYDFL